MASDPAGGTLTPGGGQDLLARFKRGWEQRDVDLILSLFEAHAEYRPDPFEPPLMGANAIRAHWNAVARDQVHVEFDAERIWVAGSTVLASWHAAVTQRADAQRVRYRGFLTFELEPGGLVTRLRAWALTRAVGHDSTFEPEAPEEGWDGPDGLGVSGR